MGGTIGAAVGKPLGAVVQHVGEAAVGCHAYLHVAAAGGFTPPGPPWDICGKISR